jgi:hypothetical protein
MTSNAPVQGSGFAHKIAAIFADIRYANLRLIELNRPWRAHQR